MSFYPAQVYDDWRAFKQHMKTHKTEGVIYRCEICSEEFLTQYEKEKHKVCLICMHTLFLSLRKVGNQTALHACIQ
jgi:DNA-directed RNA polymerase subunit RPC12/RpoP